MGGRVWQRSGRRRRTGLREAFERRFPAPPSLPVETRGAFAAAERRYDVRWRMGLYRARDLWRVPGILSLSRIPLAIAFPFALPRPVVALFVILTAGLTDVLDGWYARRFGQVTATGTAIDPVTDKLFVLTVAVSLVRAGLLAPLDVMVLSSREIFEAPLVIWIATSQRARRARAEHPSANPPGKAATVFQFVAATAALFRLRYLPWLVGAAGLVGALAAFVYWVRALREAQRSA
jgi:phosphatidylglycerophosphate synthase